MMRLRSNLRGLLRGVSEAEYESLHGAAEERRTLAVEERSEYPAPIAAEESLVGALVWASFVVWQDHPRFVVIGCGGAVISTGFRLLHLFV